MARRNSLFPRPIAPELVNVGDDISAEFPSNGGIVLTKRGTVAKIVAHAAMRYFLTEEGSALASYAPGIASDVKLTIHMRPYQHETLALFDDPDRIAS